MSGGNASSAALLLGVLFGAFVLVERMQEAGRRKDVLQVRKENDVKVSDASGIADAFNRLRTE